MTNLQYSLTLKEHEMRNALMTALAVAAIVAPLPADAAMVHINMPTVRVFGLAPVSWRVESLGSGYLV
jgi:hypothetical protein